VNPSRKYDVDLYLRWAKEAIDKTTPGQKWLAGYYLEKAAQILREAEDASTG